MGNNIDRAVLVLEDGSFFEGAAYGARGQALGEIVFATGMTGYQETLTDPSYAGQIVTMTAPHIGNTGMNKRDMESDRIWVEGLVIRDPSPVAANFRAETTLQQELLAEGVVAIAGVDTRAIVRLIRQAGAMRAGIFSGTDEPVAQLLEKVKTIPVMQGQSLSAKVSTPSPRKIPAENPFATVAVLDLGVKNNTLELLSQQGFDLWVLPYNTSAQAISELKPDAIFYSNGPGDPAASEQQVQTLRELLRLGYPYFGICFGNQLLARALGFGTKKLLFGHRGINQPVYNKAAARVEITAQNHGFAADMPIEGVLESPLGFGKVEVSHYSLNDQVVEGIRCLDLPAMSVQYHPEAAAGPHDSRYLFEEFKQNIIKRKEAANA